MIEVEAIWQWYNPRASEEIIDKWEHMDYETKRYNVQTVKEAYEEYMREHNIDEKVIASGWKYRKKRDRQIFRDTSDGAMKQVGFIVPLGFIEDYEDGRKMSFHRVRIILTFKKISNEDIEV